MKMQNVNGHLSPYCGVSCSRCGLLTLVWGRAVNTAEFSKKQNKQTLLWAPYFQHLEWKHIISRKAVAAGMGKGREAARLTLVSPHIIQTHWKQEIKQAQEADLQCKWVICVGHNQRYMSLSNIYCFCHAGPDQRFLIWRGLHTAFKRLIISRTSKISKDVICVENSTHSLGFLKSKC